jgi:hypothetical protein
MSNTNQSEAAIGISHSIDLMTTILASVSATSFYLKGEDIIGTDLLSRVSKPQYISRYLYFFTSSILTRSRTPTRDLTKSKPSSASQMHTNWSPPISPKTTSQSSSRRRSEPMSRNTRSRLKLEEAAISPRRRQSTRSLESILIKPSISLRWR